ncbi:hypothetical protein E7811_06175 [Aliigemmobacter aestuarii]|uniref:Uncharacterized protein n=1 Tax=Aliigemmobacter aestuarii TaxID=1445661 RepID=A0A4S3MS57_9RHOB|nr:hypothetical protein [Gemmobacter aestuarii]THD85287.1 hypothetical protein E7811_06175 [Gemmobacter aestuarii]
MRLRGAALALFLAAPVSAQVVGDCDWRAGLQALPEPWEQATRTFANGAVRLAVSDVIEPAAGAFYLVILSPPFDELGGRQCKVIGATPDVGFGGLTLDGMDATYNPAAGLVFRVPVSVYDPASARFHEAVLAVTLNQATGAIGAALQ